VICAMQVLVVHSPAPREVLEWTVTLPDGATVRDAIEASGFGQLRPDIDWRAAGTGVWGRKTGADHILRDGDRVEVYRPLLVDPKMARRERFRRQGGKSGGLFARGPARRRG
jgi:putative ubiquitin-RnfH superfamily antitoxin RatB of RatAB toxin-antitoxin module